MRFTVINLVIVILILHNNNIIEHLASHLMAELTDASSKYSQNIPGMFAGNIYKIGTGYVPAISAANISSILLRNVPATSSGNIRKNQ